MGDMLRDGQPTWRPPFVQPPAITDDMVERAARALMAEMRFAIGDNHGRVIIEYPRLARAALTAALGEV